MKSDYIECKESTEYDKMETVEQEDVIVKKEMVEIDVQASSSQQQV